jgi:Flp pilus assembly protein TadG
MNVNKITPKKNKAQAMVEFAIVLPILLLLLYGILEAGRLLFIYSTIVTASRQAVRYGSATGEGSSTVPRYQDCAGIRLAAQRVDYLNSFSDDDIIISWDDGPTDLTPTIFCAVGSPSDTSFAPTNNNTRLNVTIDGDYLPIVPRIVGFLERSETSASGPITAQSARTILVSVSIFVTAPPSDWTPSTSTSTNTPLASPTNTPTNTATNTATLTPVASNTPSVTPTLTLTLTKTNTPTITLTPSLTPTRVPSCNTTHGAITLPGNNTMTLTIQNPNAWPLTMGDLFVIWDHDRGHQAGNDKSLILQSVKIGTTNYWTGSLSGPNAGITPTSPMIIPAGSSVTIVFQFHQDYDRSDGSEEISINLSTPGCETSPPIHVVN